MLEIIMLCFVIYVIGKALGAQPLNGFSGPHGGMGRKLVGGFKSVWHRPAPHFIGGRWTWRFIKGGLMVLIIVLMINAIPSILEFVSSSEAVLTILGLLLLVSVLRKKH